MSGKDSGLEGALALQMLTCSPAAFPADIQTKERGQHVGQSLGFALFRKLYVIGPIGVSTAILSCFDRSPLVLRHGDRPRGPGFVYGSGP